MLTYRGRALPYWFKRAVWRSWPPGNGKLGELEPFISTCENVAGTEFAERGEN